MRTLFLLGLVGCGGGSMDVTPGTYVVDDDPSLTLVVAKVSDGLSIDSGHQLPVDTSAIPGADGNYSETTYTAHASFCEGSPNMNCMYGEAFVEVVATGNDSFELTTCSETTLGTCLGPQVTCSIADAKLKFPTTCTGTTITAHRK